MCLDPGTDHLFRIARVARELPVRRRSGGGARTSHTEGLIALPASARWALDTLAGDDDLVARGWVVLSRQAHA
ncbi:MAG TPA: hypothetical protein VMF13_17665 [Luteitalea sp.]|nr:hypothetical protein [Luteitalea sp.]